MGFDLFKNRKNIIAIILSLIIAFLLWFYAKTNETLVAERKFKLRVETPNNLIVKSFSSDSIQIRVKAKKRQHKILSNISPSVILPSSSPGIHKFKLEEDQIYFPFWLGVEDYEIQAPDSLQVELDSLIRTEVRITSIKDLSFEPDKVTVEGPKSFVSNIGYLSPDSIPQGPFTTITIEDSLVNVFPSRIKVIK